MRYDELAAYAVEDERPTPTAVVDLHPGDVVWHAGRLTVTGVERVGERVVVTYAELALPIRYASDENVRVTS